MTNPHPITPPPEIVDQWRHSYLASHGEFVDYIATQASQWGANKGVEEGCRWLALNGHCQAANWLRAAMRPKPPTMKEQALAALGWLSIEPCLINGVDVNAAVRAKYDTIRKALEALPND